MRIRQSGLLVLLLFLGLALAACTSNEPTETAADTPSATSDPVTVATVDETDAVTESEAVAVETEEAPAAELGTVESPEEPSVSIEGEIELGPDVELEVEVDLGPAGIFSGASAALAELDSYRFTSSFVFVGEEQTGEIEAGSIELTGAIMDQDHKHFVWENLHDGERFEIIQLGDEAWTYGNGEWKEVPVLVADAMSTAVMQLAPAIAWGGLFGTLETEATYVGPETVDGILAHHYASTYQQPVGYWHGDVFDGMGDVWIADAGYPLKYEFSATGEDRQGASGSISWSMELSDVNGNIVIEPPL